MDTLRAIFTADVVQSQPGNNQVSGVYSGVDNVLGLYGQLFELTGGTISVDLKNTGALSGDEVVQLYISHRDASGAPIRALYSSADGGVTENVGCVLEAERAGPTWRCKDGWPYLAVVEDPAEALAYDARGGMPHGLWAESFSGDEIRHQIIEDYGIDIGYYVWLEFNESPGGRPISVRVYGTLGSVDLKGDRFLRTTLGLKSTLVRTIPF